MKEVRGQRLEVRQAENRISQIRPIGQIRLIFSFPTHLRPETRDLSTHKASAL